MSATHTISRRVDSRRSPSPALVPEGPAAGSLVGYLRHVVVVAKRSLIKTWRTPEALIDVTVQPIIFLAMFTYIFGGAIAPSGSQQQYLQFLLPGILGQTIAMAGIALGTNLNTDIEKGIFDRFRSLPIGRSVPLVGAVAADVAGTVGKAVTLAGEVIESRRQNHQTIMLLSVAKSSGCAAAGGKGEEACQVRLVQGSDNPVKRGDLLTAYGHVSRAFAVKGKPDIPEVEVDFTLKGVR